MQLQYTRASMCSKSSLAGNQEPPTRLAGLAMLVRGPRTALTKSPACGAFCLFASDQLGADELRTLADEILAILPLNVLGQLLYIGTLHVKEHLAGCAGWSC